MIEDDDIEDIENVDNIEANDDPDLEPINLDHSLYIAEYLLSCRNTPLDILRIDDILERNMWFDVEKLYRKLVADSRGKVEEREPITVDLRSKRVKRIRKSIRVNNAPTLEKILKELQSGEEVTARELNVRIGRPDQDTQKVAILHALKRNNHLFDFRTVTQRDRGMGTEILWKLKA